MTRVATLNDIARGDATASEARSLVLEIFEAVSPDRLLDLYHALRTWLWRTLDQRRRDPELRDWHDVIAASAALVARDDAALGGKLSALKELLGETIATGARVGIAEVSRREHVAEVLEMHRDRGWVDRAEIAQRLRLGQANLSRVLNMMASAGLLERTTLGKRAAFRLTRSGIELADAGCGKGASESRAVSDATGEASLMAAEGFVGVGRGTGRRDRQLRVLLGKALLTVSGLETQTRVRVAMKHLDQLGLRTLVLPTETVGRVRPAVFKAYSAPAQDRIGVDAGWRQPRSGTHVFEAGIHALVVHDLPKDVFTPPALSVLPHHVRIDAGGKVAAIPGPVGVATVRRRQHV